MGTLYEQAIERMQRMVAEVRQHADLVARRARAAELMVMELSRQLAATEKALERVERAPVRIVVVREGVGG